MRGGGGRGGEGGRGGRTDIHEWMATNCEGRRREGRGGILPSPGWPLTVRGGGGGGGRTDIHEWMATNCEGRGGRGGEGGRGGRTDIHEWMATNFEGGKVEVHYFSIKVPLKLQYLACYRVLLVCLFVFSSGVLHPCQRAVWGGV